jgi:F0F1-type ATP synthase assembly protein I
MSADRRFPGWVRHSGIGLELAGAIAGLAFVGYWIDGRFGTTPWGMLGGVVIGLVGGLYNLVRESLAAVQDAKIEDRLASEEANDRAGPAEAGPHNPTGRGGNGD